MKKVLSVLASAVLLFGSAGVALAYTPLDYTFNLIDTVNGAISSNVPAPSYPDNGDFFFTDPTTGMAGFLGLDTSSPLQIVSNQLTIGQFPDYKIWDVDNGVPLENTILSLSAATTSLQSQINSAVSNISVLGSSVFSINTLDTQINNNLFGTSTSMLASAASTTNGLMTKAEGAKLDAMATNLPWSWATSTRSIVTGTGATGFQVSSTRNSTDRYNVTVTTTASIAGNATGYIALEVAPTNSSTASDWQEVGRCGNSQALSLAITLQSVQGTTCELTADIPQGYYAKLRSVTTTGTVSFAFVSDQEVLK